MAERYVQVQGTVTPKNGSPVSLGTIVACDAVNVVEYEVAHGASDVELLISPAVLADIVFVLIMSDAYLETTGTYNLSYKIAAAEATDIPLSTFHMYMPTQDLACGAAGLDFGSIFVSNSHISANAKLTVIVGYNVEAP
jgi:hypothetical protein